MERRPRLHPTRRFAGRRGEDVPEGAPETGAHARVPARRCVGGPAGVAGRAAEPTVGVGQEGRAGCRRRSRGQSHPEPGHTVGDRRRVRSDAGHSRGVRGPRASNRGSGDESCAEPRRVRQVRRIGRHDARRRRVATQ